MVPSRAVGACAALAVAAVVSVGRAQAPEFEAASVKVNTSGAVLSSIGFEPGGFTAINVTLRQLIMAAYGLQNTQLTGGPAWVGETGAPGPRSGGGGGPARFDVIARAPAKTRPTPLMLRTLLAQRFRLETHTETRDAQLYALIVARPDRRLGPQLRESTVDCNAVMASPPAASGPAAAKREECDAFVGVPPRMVAGGVTMAQLANALARNIRDTVIDRTQLSGRYDLELQWTPDFLPPGRDGEPLRLNGFVVDRNGPTIFTAVREQLGLELQRQKGPLDVLAIDSASLPEPD